VRLLYRSGNPLGQHASRWIHIPWNGWTETDFRTPASAGTTTTTHTITYTYDPLNRLTGADYRSTGLTAGSTGESFAYQYDAVGNRTVMTTTAGTFIHIQQLRRFFRSRPLDG
jgi:YD repeat-containing protein